MDFRDHPNARGQKRHHEEKGPFGKSMRRKSTRTATPAKKEDPNVDAFMAALQYDLEREAAEAQEKGNVSKPNEGSTVHSSTIKVPTQVSLYGFAPGTHWDSINFYERASRGYICEDYDRDPPIERRRIPNAFAAGQMVHARPLTRQEAVLARQYHGGNCWIKVTFDSAEAANRAIECSPHLIQGHWVYAVLFHGAAPDVPDEPIPLQAADLPNGSFDGAAPAPRTSKSLGPSFAHKNRVQKRSNATLPRSFANASRVREDGQEARDVTPQSSSTATSATATAPEYPNIRNRLARPQRGNEVAQNAVRPPRDPRFYAHFPDVPRIPLRPAHEAFLPQPSKWDRLVRKLRAMGLLPTDPIGDGPPFLDNGEFDWVSASFYWKVFYWLDSHLGTNFCGHRD